MEMFEGSIPAHTGEPKAVNLAHSWTRVYPRTYGGTRPRSVHLS